MPVSARIPVLQHALVMLAPRHMAALRTSTAPEPAISHVVGVVAPQERWRLVHAIQLTHFRGSGRTK